MTTIMACLAVMVLLVWALVYSLTCIIGLIGARRSMRAGLQLSKLSLGPKEVALEFTEVSEKVNQPASNQLKWIEILRLLWSLLKAMRQK